MYETGQSEHAFCLSLILRFRDIVVIDVFGKKNPAFADKATAQVREGLKIAEFSKMHSIKQKRTFFMYYYCDVKR